MSSPVDKIKDCLSIEEVVGSYMELKAAGTYLKGRCPFHREKTPSFFVSPDRGSFVCFGCGAKGDIFTFVEKIEGLDFAGALKLLGRRAGVEITGSDASRDQARDRLLQITAEARDFFRDRLTEEPNAQAYLSRRGLRSETVTDWSLGYAPSGWQLLEKKLLDRGYQSADLIRAGLSKQKADKTYDTFRQRIIFPINDSVGRPVGFSGRLYPEAESVQAPKYLNSPDSLIFNKSEILYGLDRAKDSIRRNDYAVLVEGQLDLLLSHQVGLNNTVAVSGTALTRAHLERLKRLSANLILAFDSDSAGRAAAYRSAVLALGSGLNVKLARLPDETDPADLIVKGGELWRQALREARHPIQFLAIDIHQAGLDRSAVARRVQSELFPLLLAIESEMERDARLRELADTLELDHSAMAADLNRSAERVSEPADRAESNRRSTDSLTSAADPLRILAALYRWQEQSKQPLLSPAVRAQKLNAAGILEQVQKVAAEVTEEEVLTEEIKYSNSTDQTVDKALDELILCYRIRDLEIKFTQGQAELQRAENEGSEAEVATCLNDCQKISAEIEKLKSQLAGR